MPRQDVAKYEIHLACDYCGESEHFDSSTPDEELAKGLSHWRAVMDADNPPTPQNDTHRWYDTFQCLESGEKKHTEEKAKAVEKKLSDDRAMAKVNETMKNSGMMDKALKLVQA